MGESGKIIAHKEALQWASFQLKEAGIANPRWEAELLLAYLLQLKRLQLYLHPEVMLGRHHWNLYQQLVRRRCQREPVAYIIGEKEFYGRRFRVNKNVFIPRPETELLVEAVADWIKSSLDENKELFFLEHGTGSGAVAITLALLFPRSRVWATELSPDALKVARVNARLQGVEERVTFIQANFGQNIPGNLYHAVISNPPYIPREQISALPPDVRYEPLLALDGGTDGLDAYRVLLQSISLSLKPGGLFAVELGSGQGRPVEKLCLASGHLSNMEVRRDYAGHERIFLAQFNQAFAP